MSAFTEIPEGEWLASNALAFAVVDASPASPGHALVISRRPILTWWDATADERTAMFELIDEVKRLIDLVHAPDAYNVGFNAGTAAGQTVPHLHLHVIPRYAGDVDDPRGGVRHAVPHLGNHLRPSPLVTPGRRAMALELIRALINPAHDQINLVVSFLMRSGVRIVADHIDEALARGATIRVLTTDYLSITDVAALGFFLDRAGGPRGTGRLEARVFSDPTTSFHPKGYLFSSSTDVGAGVAFVGSSNLSRSALEHGVEWNIRTRDLPPLLAAFDELWLDERTTPLTHDWLEAYRIRQLERARPESSDLADQGSEPPPAPWGIQRDALATLTATRLEGNEAGLVVMATGLGKTWLAAFDATRPEFRKTLFVAHRTEILRQARKVFLTVDPLRRCSSFDGAERDLSGDVVFASVQTLHRHLDEIEPDRFHYVCVDEFHHAEATTYRKVISHFRPRFLLGLTATPDRSDAADLLRLCGDNLVFDCDLIEGIRQGMLSPFVYRAIQDVADYAEIPWRNSRFDPVELSRRLETRQRAAQVFDEWTSLGGATRPTIGFCCSISHAEQMADFFQERGVRALAVHSGATSANRVEAIEGLQSGRVQVLLAVDLFNEGIDIPAIEVVLMLRPTESPIVFLQQIGRGLRRADGKERLDIVDLIGNHKSFLLKAQLLARLSGHEVTSRRDAVQKLRADRADLPAGCSITVDLEVIDLLERLAGRATTRDCFGELLSLWQSEHDGRRPTALELAVASNRPHDLRALDGWFGALAAEGALTEPEVAVFDMASDLLIEIEHGAYTKAFKLVTLRALLSEAAFHRGLPVPDLAVISRGLIERDHRLRTDLADTGVGPLTSASGWVAYWRKNPIHAWTGGNRATGDAHFAVDDDDVFGPTVLVPPHLRETLAAMVSEIADYRLHRYLVTKAAKRIGERRQICDAAGHPVDAHFAVEGERDRPIAIFFESSGGTAGTPSARNIAYPTGLDLLLERMRRLEIVIEDAYLDTTRTVALPLPDRRLGFGEANHAPLDLSGVDDLGALRNALLASMAAAGRSPGASGGGNRRKAFRVVISSDLKVTTTELADLLASGRFEVRELTRRSRAGEDTG